MTKLNLGCGHEILPGWVNVDKSAKSHADLRWDLSVMPWPIDTATIDEVRAHAILEHVFNWPGVLDEIARVSRPGAPVSIIVPYKLMTADLPGHVRFFWPHTLNPYCDNATMKTSVPFVRRPFVTGYYEWDKDYVYFSMVRRRYTHQYPFDWHAMKRFGERAIYWPLGRRVCMHFELTRNRRPWSTNEA